MEDILRQEEIYWHQRSRLQWLVEGERNTHFYHMTAVRRQQKRKVLCLKNEEGDWISDNTVIEGMVNDFYKKLFSAEAAGIWQHGEVEMQGLNETDAQWLSRQVSELEVENAVFQIGDFKAPGPDGMPAIFYKRCWPTVCPAIMRLVTDAFATGKFDTRLNHTFISLIPKFNPPETVCQFRPIALTNVCVKIISKVIANRLQTVIGKLVSQTQSAFLPGRGATGNILVAQEVIHYFKHKTGRKGEMMVKIDLEKAYDRVDWAFLEQVLRKINMPDSITNLIMFTMRSSSISILWNGNQLEPFTPTRGLRQGDPLAPYLFDLCMEVLSLYIKKSVAVGDWKPIKISRQCPPLTHIFFADDIILFGEATTEQAIIMKSVLDVFCDFSGEKISFRKSTFHLSKNVKAQPKHSIGEHLEMLHVDDFGKYLGVPLLHERMRVSNYSYLLDKMRKKLASWKSRYLSKAGKMILIQSSLSTHPYYIMQTTKMPLGCVQAMEKICRAFFWGETDGERKMHYLSWDTLCQPKQNGGLGFKHLAEMNIALLGKLVWHLLVDDDSLWIRVLGLKYGDPFQTPKPTDSSTWKGICLAARYIKENVESSENAIIWKGSNNQKFTVADAYGFLTNGGVRHDDFPWLDLWRLKGPHRFNYTLWQVAHERLPTFELLYHRHVSDTPVCPVCCLEVESHLHALRDCPKAKHVWRYVLPSMHWAEFFSYHDVNLWVEANIRTFKPTQGWVYTFRELIYSIWRQRNQFVHDPEVVAPPMDVFLSQAAQRVKNLRLAWDL